MEEVNTVFIRVNRPETFTGIYFNVKLHPALHYSKPNHLKQQEIISSRDYDAPIGGVKLLPVVGCSIVNLYLILFEI